MSDSKARARHSRQTDADAKLWRTVVSDVKPLSGRKPTPAEPAIEQELEERQEPEERKALTGRHDPARARRSEAPPHPPELPRLSPGRSPGLDRRRSLRLRRGQMPIEDSIDLHGLTQVQAARTLCAFLAAAQEAGRRCVLVITGKGNTRDEGGVLRAITPRWLNEPANRKRILAFEVAQPKHGGQGALYVLLRRRQQLREGP